ncbi:MAG: SurA N-terminal domain-containing protein [Methylococcales bacterium]|nr:SurA N-terminal domain-containing protein [Methylococcales bacterium]
MLLEIREKVHGVFASVILVFMCVLFGLWGIQNYLGGGKEAPIVTVGDKDFFLNDVNQAYQQYVQSLGGMKFDEETLRKQALNKLVRDEVLLQYVGDRKLLISDDTAKDFIKTLDYFKRDGKFDKGLYQSLLSSQGMSSDEFISRIKKALLMEQFQRSIVDSSFITPAEMGGIFKIQNESRDLEYVSVPLKPENQLPDEDQILSYYQQHLDNYQTEEQVSVDYVELSLDTLAAQITPSEEQLKAYYEEQKAQFTSKERRRISHILFAFTKDPAADQLALQRALQAEEALKTKDFATLAKEISDDKQSAKNGGDLGLFNVGVMEKAFEDAAANLKLGEVSAPVKSAFGYHLIKVTELAPGDIKTYDEIKPELIKSYQRAQAENTFNTLGEKLAEVSYENPDNLDAASKVLGVPISKTGLFTHQQGEGIAADEKVRLAAFSEDVLKGTNSEPIEIGGDKLVVLRMQSHLPAASKELKDIKSQVIADWRHDKAQQQAKATAEQIKTELLAGKPLEQLAQGEHLKLEKIKDLKRNSPNLPPQVIQTVFRAPKPQPSHPSAFVVDEPGGGEVVASITAVTTGEMTDADKIKQAMIRKNVETALGRAQFEAVLNALQAKADIVMHPQKQ